MLISSRDSFGVLRMPYNAKNLQDFDFDVFRQTLRFNFRLSIQSSFYVFGVFVVEEREGTPAKRVSEGLFRRFSTKFAF